MKLLIITQKIDERDDVLGFMHGWIAGFARECEKVTAIGLSVGKHHLPKNVEVLSLGKEGGRSRLRSLARLYWYAWSRRREYDAVFVHMNQVYINVTAPLWRLLGKKISLWYAHGHVPRDLRFAELFTQRVFTSTESGFRIVSDKKRVVGQAIDTERFAPSQEAHSESSFFRIVTVGRITPAKDYETLIDAVALLSKQGKKVLVTVIGRPALGSDEQYFEKIKKSVAEKGLSDSFNFVGAVANVDLPSHLQSAQIFVNMGKTGSLDKVVPEAMATGLPILTCNEALLEVLGPYTQSLIYPKNDSRVLAQKIAWLMDMSLSERIKIGTDLREIVVREHSLPRFVRRIVAELEATPVPGRVIRFFLAGLVSFLVNIGFFTLLLRAGIWYLLASMCAFIASIVVSFLLQKYWTFRDSANILLARQFVAYCTICMINLLLNTAVVYSVVDILRLPPVIGQIAGSVAVAFSGYRLYQRYVFTQA